MKFKEITLSESSLELFLKESRSEIERHKIKIKKELVDAELLRLLEEQLLRIPKTMIGVITKRLEEIYDTE